MDVVNVLFFIRRFQAPDLEVKLSDELAGSLRQLKVLNKLNFLVLLDLFPVRKCNPLSVMTFVSNMCIILSTVLYYLKLYPDFDQLFPKGLYCFLRTNCGGKAHL